MLLKELECYDLLRLQHGAEDIVRYHDGKLKFRRNGIHSDFFYENGKVAAELDLIGKSKRLSPTYALNAFYKNGAHQLQATGYQNQAPTWYNYFNDKGQRQAFVSSHLVRHWDEHGNTIVCRGLINKQWKNLLETARQANPSASQQLINRVINELIYTLRGNEMLPPYDSEYNFKIRKSHMMNLYLKSKSR